MIRNCLGLTLDDLKRDLFARLDTFTLSWILQQKCNAGTPGSTALSNFDSFNIYSAKKALDYLNNADANNRHIQGDDLFGFLRDLMPSLLSDFSNRQCVGDNNAIDDVVKVYKPDPYTNMYPSGVTPAERDKLLDLLQDTHFFDDVRTQVGTGVGTTTPSYTGTGSDPWGNPNGGPTNGGPVGNGTLGSNTGGATGDGVPIIIINDNDVPGTSGLTDKTDSLFGDSILTKIPMSVVEKLDIDRATYTKCFKTLFELDCFIVPDSPQSKPVVTQGKVQNLRRLHNEILLPIYRYYYGDEGDVSCKMRMHGGLTSIKTAYTLLGSSLATRHTSGEAVSFSLISVSNDVILQDIREGKIKIDFGYCALANGLFITLPLTFEGYEVRGIVMRSPTFDDTDIRIDFA